MSKEIIEGNFLIAKFCGFIYPDTDNAVFKANLHDLHNYHEDWNKLMPVVEMIESMDDKNVDCFVEIRRREVHIYFDNGIKQYDWSIGSNEKVKSVWDSVVRFIQFYNTHNQQQVK